MQRFLPALGAYVAMSLGLAAEQRIVPFSIELSDQQSSETEIALVLMMHGFDHLDKLREHRQSLQRAISFEQTFQTVGGYYPRNLLIFGTLRDPTASQEGTSIVAVVPFTRLDGKISGITRSVELFLELEDPSANISVLGNLPVHDDAMLVPDQISMTVETIEQMLAAQMITTEDNRLRLYGLLSAAVDRFDAYSGSQISEVMLMLDSLLDTEQLKQPDEYRRRYFQALTDIIQSGSYDREIEFGARSMPLIEYAIEKYEMLLASDAEIQLDQIDNAFQALGARDAYALDCLNLANTAFFSLEDVGIRHDAYDERIEDELNFVGAVVDCLQRTLVGQAGLTSTGDLERGVEWLCSSGGPLAQSLAEGLRALWARNERAWLTAFPSAAQLLVENADSPDRRGYYFWGLRSENCGDLRTRRSK